MEIAKDTFQRVEKKSLTDYIHDSILEMIIRNSLGADSVFTENKLTQVFGVSKAPVREALVRLCNENVLRSIQRYGYVIVQLSRKDAEDIHHFRMLLEMDALEQWFPLVSGHNTPEMDAYFSRSHQELQADSVWEVWKDNIDFHSQLLAFSGNNVIGRFLRESMEMQARFFAQSTWKNTNSFSQTIDVEQHAVIYRAIQRGDRELTIKLLENDINNVAL